jgi:hypothetical protein
LDLFGEGKFDDSLKQAYATANEELKTLGEFETKLRSDGASLDAYLRYLDYEECQKTDGQKDKTKVLIQIVDVL